MISIHVEYDNDSTGIYYRAEITLIDDTIFYGPPMRTREKAVRSLFRKLGEQPEAFMREVVVPNSATCLRSI